MIDFLFSQGMFVWTAVRNYEKKTHIRSYTSAFQPWPR